MEPRAGSGCGLVGFGRRIALVATACDGAHQAQASQQHGVGLWLGYCCRRRKTLCVVANAVQQTKVAGLVVARIGTDDLREAGGSGVDFGSPVGDKAEADHTQGSAVRIVGLFGTCHEHVEGCIRLVHAHSRGAQATEVVSRETLNTIFGTGVIGELVVKVKACSRVLHRRTGNPVVAGVADVGQGLGQHSSAKRRG